MEQDDDSHLADIHAARVRKPRPWYDTPEYEATERAFRALRIDQRNWPARDRPSYYDFAITVQPNHAYAWPEGVYREIFVDSHMHSSGTWCPIEAKKLYDAMRVAFTAMWEAFDERVAARKASPGKGKRGMETASVSRRRVTIPAAALLAALQDVNRGTVSGGPFSLASNRPDRSIHRFLEAKLSQGDGVIRPLVQRLLAEKVLHEQEFKTKSRNMAKGLVVDLAAFRHVDMLIEAS
jgi:hypothetical protein